MPPHFNSDPVLKPIDLAPSEKVIAVRVIDGHRQRLIEINGQKLLEITLVADSDQPAVQPVQQVKL